jgi:hypothetical protein
VAGCEGPDSGAVSVRDRPDAYGRKTKALGGLWKRPDAGSFGSSACQVTSSQVRGGARPEAGM